MNQSPPNLVVAFEMLVEELEAEIDQTNRQGGADLADGEYAHAQKALERGQALLVLRKELLALGDRIRALSAGSPPRQQEEHPRLRKGLKTPQDTYRLPILRALVQVGGSASMGDVLDRVFDLLQGQLNEYDLAPMPSDPKTLRWRNTAQWERNLLREEGFISDQSPRGIWEITEKGRQWLKAQDDTG